MYGIHEDILVYILFITFILLSFSDFIYAFHLDDNKMVIEVFKISKRETYMKRVLPKNGRDSAVKVSAPKVDQILLPKNGILTISNENASLLSNNL